MWADTDTDKDFLNYGELAEVVALMLIAPRLLPLSIGVSGGWGTGKSSFRRMVEAKLPPDGKDADGRHTSSPTTMLGSTKGTTTPGPP